MPASGGAHDLKSDAMNPLQQLDACGQSQWVDHLSRGFLTGGGLKKLIEQDGVKGVTSNPSIFEKAIAETDEYAKSISEFQTLGDRDVSAICEHLAIADIESAADALQGVYDRTKGRDGYVSLECSPYLANDTAATVTEALRLWAAVARPNLIVKFPATPEGVVAIRRLVGHGLNINVPLLFSIDVYEDVVEAYMAGLEHFRDADGDLSRVAGVASFFVSRIDQAVSARLDALGQKLQTEHLHGVDARPIRACRPTAASNRISLDNQREASEAYIKSQAHEGWKLVRDPRAWWTTSPNPGNRIPRAETDGPAGAQNPEKSPGFRSQTGVLDANLQVLRGILLIPSLTDRDSRRASQAGLGLIQGGERRRFVMPVPLRADFDAVGVRALAKKSKNGAQARRLLAVAAIYDGASRTEAAKIAGVTLQIIRDWVVKFNALGPAGLIDRKAPGRAPRLSEEHRKALAAMIESGPIPAVHGVVRWRIVDLSYWLFEEFRVSVSKQTLSRQLRAMGYRKLSARPRHHAQAQGAIEDFKKVSPRVFARSR
jgi:transaldolase